MSKFVIRTVASGIKFDLVHTNGQVIATSEVYASRKSCLGGVDSVKRCAAVAGIEDQTVENAEKVKHPKFEMYVDKAGEFLFRLKAANGQIVATSEGYKAKASCVNGIEYVKKNAPEAEIAE